MMARRYKILAATGPMLAALSLLISVILYTQVQDQRASRAGDAAKINLGFCKEIESIKAQIRKTLRAAHSDQETLDRFASKSCVKLKKPKPIERSPFK